MGTNLMEKKYFLFLAFFFLHAFWVCDLAAGDILHSHDKGPKAKQGQTFISFSSDSVTIDSNVKGFIKLKYKSGTKQIDTLYYVHPINTPYAAAFPSANLAMTIDFQEFDFFEVQDEYIAELGTIGVHQSKKRKKPEVFLWETKFMPFDTFYFHTYFNKSVDTGSYSTSVTRESYFGKKSCMRQHIITYYQWNVLDSISISEQVYYRPILFNKSIHFNDSLYMGYPWNRSNPPIYTSSQFVDKEIVYSPDYEKILFYREGEIEEDEEGGNIVTSYVVSGASFSILDTPADFFRTVMRLSDGSFMVVLRVAEIKGNVKWKVTDMSHNKKLKIKVDYTKNREEALLSFPKEKSNVPIVLKIEMKTPKGVITRMFSTQYL